MYVALVLRGMAQRTQESCIGAVGLLARYFVRSPDTLSAQQVQDDWLHLCRERGRTVATLSPFG
jgi:hypothetical protein